MSLESCINCRHSTEQKGYLSEQVWLVCDECAAAEPMPVNDSDYCPMYQPKSQDAK